MIILVNSEDPDEIPHSAVFQQGLHFWQRHKHFSEKEIQFHLKIRNCDPWIFAIDPSKLIGSDQKEYSIIA